MKKSLLTNTLVTGMILYAFLGTAEAALPLSLADSIRMAMKHNETVRASLADREAARWQLSAARREAGPTVAWESRAYRIGGRDFENYRQAHRLAPERYPDPYKNSFANTVGIRFPLFTGGRIEETIKASRYQLNAADMALENTKQSMRFAVTDAYYNILQRKNLVTVAESAFRMSSEQLSLIETQYEEGSLAKSDVLHMQVEMANYRQSLVSAKGALQIAEASLLSLLGLPENTEIETTDSLTYEPYPLSLEECLAYAEANRPDAAAADYAIKQADARVRAARSGDRPGIAAVANKTVADNKAFRDDRSENWEAGIQLSWNVFDNNVTHANVKTAKASAERARAEAEGTDKAVRLETRSAYIKMKAAEDNIRSAEAAVKQAEENLTIAQVRYEEGVDILLSLTDAQEKLVQARTNYYSALYEYNLGKAELEKAMGVPVDIAVPRYVAEQKNGKSPGKALQAAVLTQNETARK